MTPALVTELKRLEKAATAGPWSPTSDLPSWAIASMAAQTDVVGTVSRAYRLTGSEIKEHLGCRLRDADLICALRNAAPALLEAVETMHAALEFYADEKKWFMREEVTNLQQTTAVFHAEKPEELPTEFKGRSYQCTARLKIDQGKTATEALARVAALLGEGREK